MKDLIISAYTNYSWDNIRYWANSIDRCGFTGDKAIIAYNSNRATVQKLIDLGFHVWAFQQDNNGDFVWPGPLVIVVQRFFHLWQYLNQFPDDRYRYVIATDCKDVIFQTNPSKWLEENLGDKRLVASCESIRYRDEPWGLDNIKGSFPWLPESFHDNPIWNCGVQAGSTEAMRDMFLSIWGMSQSAKRPNPDQAAYNVLINSLAYRQLTRFSMSEDGWACQAGTTVDPKKIDRFQPHLLEPQPFWDGNRVLTSTGTEFAIVHQWDRIPQWTTHIERTYS